MIIGLGKFKMEIDIAAETKKMRKEMRKVGDKSGIGCTQEDFKDKHHKHHSKQQDRK